MKELLIPVGNMECLKMAIMNGADAVYLGGKRFGARAFAGNFLDDEMVEAIEYVHLYGKKIYVTVNTLIYESEFASALEYVGFLYEHGVDAVIMQDIGLMTASLRQYPELIIHASTQVHTTNKEAVKFLERIGVSRIVFARELSLEEIELIDTPLEKEAFIHGALCISYSGQCLFSSCVMNRSGNRGMCAQMCRLPYQLFKNEQKIETEGKYILSPKELNTTSIFKEIMDSTILSLKVEGRMKSPEYVACVTRLYRDLMDKYEQNKPVIPDETLLKDLTLIFNRKFTKGFIGNVENYDFMNNEMPNHIGIPIGSVKKFTHEFIYIALEEDIVQGDGIRFMSSDEGFILNYLYDTKGKLIHRASKGDIVCVKVRKPVLVGEKVHLTSSSEVLKKYRECNEIKIPVQMNVVLECGKEAEMTLFDGVNTVSISFGHVLEACNQPMTKEAIERQVRRLGNTPFCLDKLSIKMDENIFISIKELNELRRQAISFLVEKRKHCNRHLPTSLKLCEKKRYKQEEKVITVFVKTEEQLLASLECNVRRIYTRNKKLYQKYRDLSSLYLETSRTGEKASEKSLVTEIGALSNKNSIGDYTLNICNHETVNVLSDNLKSMTLSIELPLEEIKELMVYYKGSAPVEVFVYGRVRLMLLKYCLLKDYVNKASVCSICSEQNYYLVDRNGKKYPLETDPIRHMTTVMHYKQIDRIDDIKHYITYGITCFRIDFYDESKEEAQKIIRKVQGEL